MKTTTPFGPSGIAGGPLAEVEPEPVSTTLPPIPPPEPGTPGWCGNVEVSGSCSCDRCMYEWDPGKAPPRDARAFVGAILDVIKPEWINREIPL